MYDSLKKAYRLFDRVLARVLSPRHLHAYHVFALKVGRRLFPGRIAVRNATELDAMSQSQHWSPPTMPAWVYEELLEISEIDPDVHPRGELVRSAVYGHTQWTYDLPGECYFELRSKLPRHLDVILFVPWLKTGGADLGAIHFANALVEHFGKSVAVIATEDDSSPWSNRLDPRVTFLEAGASLGLLHEQHKIDVIVRLLLQVAPEIMHVMNSRPAWEAIKRNGLAIRQQTRLFGSLYCDDVTAAGQRVGYARSYLGACYSMLDGVITDNPVSVAQWCEGIGIDPSLFSVVRFPAPTGTVSPTSGMRAGRRALWAGRLDRQKRPDLLAKIAVAMPDWTFDVHGASVLDHSAAEGLAALPNVVMHGSFESFAAVADGSHDAYLYTSQWDGLPTVLFAAAAAGMPIVASGVGGITDFLPAEQLVQPFDDVQGYVKLLERVASDPVLAEQWRKRQRARIETAHTDQSFREAIEAVPHYLFADGRGDAAPLSGCESTGWVAAVR